MFILKIEELMSTPYKVLSPRDDNFFLLIWEALGQICRFSWSHLNLNRLIFCPIKFDLSFLSSVNRGCYTNMVVFKTNYSRGLSSKPKCWRWLHSWRWKIGQKHVNDITLSSLLEKVKKYMKKNLQKFASY